MPRLTAVAIALACAFSGVSSAATWTDTPVARLEALALMESLNAEILSSSSATLTLERWCRDHALANPPQVLARRVDAPSAPSAPSARPVRQVRPVPQMHQMRQRRCQAPKCARICRYRLQISCVTAV